MRFRKLLRFGRGRHVRRARTLVVLLGGLLAFASTFMAAAGPAAASSAPKVSHASTPAPGHPAKPAPARPGAATGHTFVPKPHSSTKLHARG